jgi:hypothetical protein
MYEGYARLRLDNHKERRTARHKGSHMTTPPKRPVKTFLDAELVTGLSQEESAYD